jgi:inosine-uridine nucleoside N-ribohydrolase
MTPGAYRIIHDVDTGHDDALAILLAAPHLEILGITTVSGNAPLSKTTVNTLKILELAGLTAVPVAAGMDRALLAEQLHGAAIHGESGMDGPVLPTPTTPMDPRHGVTFLIDTIRQHPGCWLVPTGPLTNVAMALRQAPDLANHLAGISLMGGTTLGGNVTPAAEFNIYVDPEAAAVVFGSGIPIKMFGLNVTRQALVLDDEVRRIRGIGTHVAEIVAQLLEFYNGSARRVFGRTGGWLHDPCAVAWMIDPSLFEFRPMHVGVELNGTRTRGMTVCDFRYEGGTADHIPIEGGMRRGQAPNVDVAMRLDRGRFFDLLVSTLATYR